VVAERLYPALQPPAPALWACFQRTLQSLGGGRQRQWISADGLRLGASESGAGPAVAAGTAAAGVSLEQFWWVPGDPAAPTIVAAGGPSAGRTWHRPGHGGGAAGVRTAPGGAAGGGRQSGGAAGDSARLVSGPGVVQSGVAGADGGEVGRTSCR